jgi:cell division septation protein DedD
VTQVTDDPTEDGFHEIQLSGKQLIFLFMATTVVSVVIFLCGVLVGRDMGAGGIDAPIDNPAVSSEGLPPETVAGDAAPPAGTAAPPAPVDLSYHEELQNGKPKPAKPLTKPEPPAAAPPAAASEPAAPSPATSKPAAAPAEPAVKVPTSGRPGTWVIQVGALQNRAAASSIVQSLIAKGYPAFLLQPAKGAPAIYRVQIGRYDDRREAEQVARRLEKEQQFKPDIKR